MSLTTLAQTNYPILVKEHNQQIVKLTKNQADDLKNKIKSSSKIIKKLTEDSVNLSNRIDTLQYELLKIKKEFDLYVKKYNSSLDTVKKFKERIYSLCSNEIVGSSGVIIYRKNFTDTSLYIIDLSDYNMKITTVYNFLPYNSREKITLIPVINNRRWYVDVPQHQNLGLHMYPHDGINDKNKKLIW